MSNFRIQNILHPTGNARSSAAKKNIYLLFVFNGFNFIFNILLVRFTLQYLGKENYGVWVTLASVLTWFSNLDFGLGNGLRNKLAEAFAGNDFQLAKGYVSTTYGLFSIAILILYIGFYALGGLIDWAVIFNTSEAMKNDLSKLVLYMFTFFMLNFILKLISFIVMADQKPAINGFFNFLSNFVTVASVYLLMVFSSSSILLLGIVSSAIPVVIFFGASVILFMTRYRKISPSIRYINFRYSKELVGLGFKFFIIQASTLVLFATDNLIITQLFGPEQVTIYNVAFRYFNYIPIVFFIILTPLWSAYTDAYVKGDFDWIKNTMRTILKVWIVLSVCVLIMIGAADSIYDIWLNSAVKVPFLLTSLMGLFAIISNWNNIFAYFLNGVGKIQLQLYTSIAVALINIPLSIWFAKSLDFGISGIIMGTLSCLFIGTIWAPIQYFKIVNRKDHGIWSK